MAEKEDKRPKATVLVPAKEKEKEPDPTPIHSKGKLIDEVAPEMVVCLFCGSNIKD